ncbi:MAG: ABC transporter permease [Pyrinomonadaceae bacterium]
MHSRDCRITAYANNSLTRLNLGSDAEWLDAGAQSSSFGQTGQLEAAAVEKVPIPAVVSTTEGVRANLKQLIAAFGIEFRLPSAERGLIVIVPLATFLCVLSMAAYQPMPDGLYTAAYAARMAESLLLFLFAIAIFFTGESMHRDRELRVEPVLWSVPAPDFVLLLSKFSATLLLSFSFSLLVGLAAIALQIFRGHTPFEIPVYLKLYTVILLPSMVFMISAVTVLNVLLRDKYLTYAVSLAVGGGLFYLFNLGYNHWLYNPVLYGLWTPSDLDGTGGNLTRILTHRVYCLALATLFLSLAHLFFERKSTGGLRVKNRLRGAGGSALIIFFSTVIAVITGLMIGGRV